MVPWGSVIFSYAVVGSWYAGTRILSRLRQRLSPVVLTASTLKVSSKDGDKGKKGVEVLQGEKGEQENQGDIGKQVPKTWYDQAQLHLLNPIETSSNNHPRVRCGTYLDTELIIPTSSVLFSNNVISVELALQWEQQTKFYDRETYTTGFGKNKQTKSRLVTYRGNTIREATNKIVLWTDDDDDENEEYLQLLGNNKVSTTAEETFALQTQIELPLGLGPSFMLESKTKKDMMFHYFDIKSDSDQDGNSEHTLQLRANFEPIEMTTLNRFLIFDWGYVFGFGPNKNEMKYHPSERINIAEQSLYVLPSISKRSNLLNTSNPIENQDTKTFYSIASLHDSLQNIFSFTKNMFSSKMKKVHFDLVESTGDGDEVRPSFKTKEEEDQKGVCNTTLFLDSNVLIVQREEAYKGVVSWENKSQHHLIEQVVVTVERQSTLVGERASHGADPNYSLESTETATMYEQTIYQEEQKKDQKKDQKKKKNDSRKSSSSVVDFDLVIPPLTPSFDTDLFQIEYILRCKFHYGGTYVGSMTSDIEIPICLVSQVIGDQRQPILLNLEDIEEIEETEELEGQRQPISLNLEEIEEIEEIKEIQKIQKIQELEGQGQNEEVVEEMFEAEEEALPLTPEQEYSEAVTFVAHCRSTHNLLKTKKTKNKNTNDNEELQLVTELLVDLWALRTFVTVGGSWRSYERKKASQRRSERHKRKNSHSKRKKVKKERRTDQQSRSNLMSCSEEVENIVTRLPLDVLNKWKNMDDTNRMDAQREYVRYANELMERMKRLM